MKDRPQIDSDGFEALYPVPTYTTLVIYSCLFFLWIIIAARQLCHLKQRVCTILVLKEQTRQQSTHEGKTVHADKNPKCKTP